ncbi:MAG: hypothetical protein ONB17_03645 [candidate division KSB1 bacterium]|nr:hypothetical protein [candidate division KSB1 bacterium]MDZ7385735.1 hypothetical protein [candidate division KSB1 bacterium]MDZ7392123.1 hypothetical protein [candidate division KSB1 bacterium]MDZ7413822.1 hypothetical protein [candidate division KSB1 bacterium]
MRRSVAPVTEAGELLPILRDFALNNGAALFGACKLGDLQASFHFAPGEAEGLDSALSMGVRLSQAILDGLHDGPTLLYKWHYRQANALLDRLAFLIAGLLQERGWRAVPVPASQVVDWHLQVGHLSHRHVAVAAGLGWLGRNNLLVSPAFGAQVRLVTVLTDLPVPQPGLVEFGCQECRACISACPAQAIGETAADFQFQRCYDQVRAYAKSRSLGVYICGICQRVCPGRTSTKPSK